MKHACSLVFYVFLIMGCCSATAQTDYEAWKHQHLQRYKSFSQDYQNRYREFKKRLAPKWGEEPELSSNSSFVSYSKDLNQKTVLDFDKQEIRVEILEGNGSVTTAQDIKQTILQFTSQSVSAAAAEDPLLSDVNVSDTRSLAVAMVPDQSFAAAIEQSVVEVQETKVNPAPEHPGSTVSAKTGTAAEKRVKQYTVKLGNKNLLQHRAAAYKEYVSKASKEYKLDSSLLLAIMQVESSFNPMAQSPIPAFGLMQIVPESAGKDVNTRVFKIKKAPSPEQLFAPAHNIKFGSAYLNILETNYLSSVTDPLSRHYCVIAAYNTGAGNVASVFHPKREKAVAEAIKVINTLTPKQVYEKLITELPYDETRKYLRKVTEAIPNYATELSDAARTSK
ncbi:transglycosylase SLT domain-containing protein [Rheinheimera mangrovi]|uniref:transglycosylase SLT domain-containing protein n=1 Tax=Rheinheimera mangrovi TaxID=2498451 RepID=UPI000F8F182D|nr:transglycosylase SLT domain-containing protein [Rheinheimera mangrovi]